MIRDDAIRSAETHDSATATATLADTRGASRADDERPELERGQGIGRYLVLERLGAGAMGVVFAAYDPELDRRVAIKVLHARHGGERAQARLVREAQALARVTHACVVAVHDVGVHEGRVFLAMEYVEGRTLRAFMADGAHGLAERLRVLVLAGEGLAAAHKAGLVHRDFKPDNVMIGARGEVKVMDFGLARSDEGESSSVPDDLGDSIEDKISASSRRASSRELTQVGAVIGTPAYMAPEQLASLPADARSDQFGFGVTAYEVLYGARPFVAGNLSGLASAIRAGRIADPPKHARVPVWLRRVVVRALASDPGDRWPDLDSLLDALRSDPARRRRRRWITGAALGLSALAGGVLVWSLVAPSPPASRCSDPVAGIEGRWDAAERSQLEQALGHDPATQGAAATVLASLDAYALAWDAAAADNCTSTHVERRQSERVEGLRRGCLRHRRIAFEELVGALGRLGELGRDGHDGHDSEDASARAVEAAARLPTIAACADVEALELEPALPTDPDQRAEVEVLRDEIAAIESVAQMAGGSTLARARKLKTRADVLGYPPVQAEAALVLGNALANTDALADAVTELRRAYFVAMSCAHARTQAKAATALVYAVGYLQQDHVRGREWSEHALAIVARIDEGGLIEADAQHALGVLFDAAGEQAASLAAYTRGYELRKPLLPAQHPDLARSLNAIGNSHHALGQLEQARDDYERALAMRLELFGPDHPVLAGSLNNLALVLSDLGELEQAKAMLERTVVLTERSGGAHAKGLPRALTNLAEIERLLHHYPRALELEQRSLAIRRATVGDLHPEVADSILGLARIARDQGDLEQAESLARDGLVRLRRDFASGHPEIFRASVVMASVLEARGQAGDAIRLIVAVLAESKLEDLNPRELGEAQAMLGRLQPNP